MGVVVAFEQAEKQQEHLAELAWGRYQALREIADSEGTKEAHFEAGKALGRFYKIISGMSK